MKISSILAAGLFAASMIVGGGAVAASGKVEAVENGGRSVTIAGTKYSISASRTKITVNGKEGSRDDIKVGMTCDAKGKGEASSISCKK